MSKLLIIVILISATISVIRSQSDRFDEELFLRPLQSGHVYSHFQFTTRWDVNQNDENAFRHYHLFPKSLGEVLAKFSVQELHLSLTQGLWRHRAWGYPIYDAPPGAEIWVWFREDTVNVDKTWTELINVLSGLFCASLNFMDATTTVSPKFSFRPHGASNEFYVRKKSNLLKYAALAKENVCTENLTPWKKLLPCSSRAGLSTLFNAVKLYDASYHSLGVHYKPVCRNSNCSDVSVELSQTMSVVFEPARTNTGKQDWSIKSLFGRSLGSSCPLATDSRVYVDLTENKTLEYYVKLSPEPDSVELVSHFGVKRKYAMYNIPQQISQHHVLNLAATYNRPFIASKVQEPLLSAHRFQTGYGQAKGGITCLLYNNHYEDLVVSYMETIPWYLRTYLHTLRVQYFKTRAVGENGTTIKPTNMHYLPGRDRERCYLLELIIRLPANSLTELSIQFERALLKWTEYPPDASHGFYVPSATISTVLPSHGSALYLPRSSSKIQDVLQAQGQQFFLRVHTESLLVMLPTPDFSMPYNVICLACTVVAIAFGSIHNLTTRRFTILDPNKKSILQKIKLKITGIFKKKSPAHAPVDKTGEDNSKDSHCNKDSPEEKKKDK